MLPNGVIQLKKITKIKRRFKEGVNMLVSKKTQDNHTVATKKEVLAALQVVNENYSKALSMLAK